MEYAVLRTTGVFGFSCLACFMILACAKVDYAYRHDVAGRVVDGQTGRGITGAIIERIEDGVPQGAVRDLYRRETDADGRFRFEYSGLGGKPEQCQLWVLQARANGYQPTTISNTIAWQPYREGSTGFGYILTNLDIKILK